MAIEVQCAKCSKRYKVGDALAGKKVKCKNCGGVMSVPSASAAARPSSGAAPAVRSPSSRPTPPPSEDADSFEAIAAMAAMEENAPVVDEPRGAVPLQSSGRRGTVYSGPPPVVVESAPRGFGPRKKASKEQKAAVWGGSGVVALLVVLKIISISIRAYNATHSSDPDTSSSSRSSSHPRPDRFVSGSEDHSASGETPGGNQTPGNSTAATPDWNNVPKRIGNGADNAEVANGSRQRLGPDGKPIPLPPIDAGYSEAAPVFTDDPDTGVESAPKRRGGTSAVPSLIQLLEAPPLGEFEEIRASARPGPWVYLRRREEAGARWESYQVADQPDAWKPAGKILLPEGGSEALFSPGGEYLVRPANGKIEVFSFANGARLQQIDGTGMTDMVGFLNAEQFVVSGGERSMLAIVNAKTGQKVRDLIAPVGMKFHGNECSISPGGDRIAVPVSAEPAPLVLLYNAGGGIDRRLPVPGMEKERRFWVKPLASSFSPDGKKLAVVYSLERILRVYCFSVIDGRILGIHEFFDVWHDGGNLSPLVQWLGDTDCLLLRGYVIMDVPTGRVLGFTAKDLRFWHDLGGGKMLIRQRLATGPQPLNLCAIDTELMTSRKAWAKSAGPLLFEPIDPLGTKFASNIQPKTGDAKPGAPPDPVSPVSKLAEAPLALDAPYANVQKVLFGKPDVAAAVVAVAPADANRHEWNALRDSDSTLQRIDLSAGTIAGPVHVPLFSKLIATSPDATLAVIVSDAIDAAAMTKTSARLDVIPLATGKTLASFVPYGDAPAGGDTPAEKASVHAVTWAGMPDNDGLITLSGGHLLVRWSIGSRRAIWARAGVAGPIAFSPGRRFLAMRQESALLIVDAKTGDVAGSLAAEPVNGAEVKSMIFSRDGEAFYAATSNGLVRWDVKTGQAEAPLIPQVVESLEDVAGKLLLLDGRLFDTEKKAFVFTYSVYGGHHLYGGPAGRHWYIARAPGQGAPYLCSAIIPTQSEAAIMERLAAHPPLIRPGVQVALQVSAGGASDKITQALTRRLKARHLDEGEAVATLRVSAQSVATGEVVPINSGMSPFNSRPTGETLTVQNYECFYQMVGPEEKILYGSPTSVIHGQSHGTFMLKQGETIQGKVEELLVNQVVGWASGIYIPSYMSADGKLVPRAEAMLGVRLPEEGNPAPTTVPSILPTPQ